MSYLLAVTQLSDSRLQLWAISQTGVLFSAWQVSLDPAQPWTSLSPFNPSPGIAFSAVAGFSPDGRVQLWITNETRTLTTWKTTPDSDAGWLPWQLFSLPAFAGISALGQLADGRMQLFAVVGVEFPFSLWTTWKTSSASDATWSAWQKLNPQIPPADGPDGAISSRAVVGSLSDGRLQAWVRGGQYNDASLLYSSWQTSTDPGVAWANWQRFNDPSPGMGLNGAAQLCTGLTRLWIISNDGTLQSIQKTSNDASSDWAAWENPFLPNPGPVFDVVVGKLNNGSAQIWVMTPPAADNSVQVLTSRQLVSGNPGRFPLPPGWTNWVSIGTIS
jgi:hypothetical protein